MTISDMARGLCEKRISVLRSFAGGLDKLHRSLIKSCSVGQFPLKRWWRLREHWMLYMSRHLFFRMAIK